MLLLCVTVNVWNLFVLFCGVHMLLSETERERERDGSCACVQ